ncbi:hypothetical protein KI387_011337, partial [Taxus chinensis]
KKNVENKSRIASRRSPTASIHCTKILVPKHNRCAPPPSRENPHQRPWKEPPAESGGAKQ